jgi:hypothetical protein
MTQGLATASVTFTIDQAIVLQWSGTLNRTFDGFGFSGANGQVGSQWHIIDDFSTTVKDLYPPSLTTSCVASVSQSSYQVKINGALTFNGAGIANAPSFYHIALHAENPGRTSPSYMQVQLAATPFHGSYPLQEITC